MIELSLEEQDQVAGGCGAELPPSNVINPTVMLEKLPGSSINPHIFNE